MPNPSIGLTITGKLELAAHVTVMARYGSMTAIVHPLNILNIFRNMLEIFGQIALI